MSLTIPPPPPPPKKKEQKKQTLEMFDRVLITPMLEFR